MDNKKKNITGRTGQKSFGSSYKNTSGSRRKDKKPDTIQKKTAVTPRSIAISGLIKILEEKQFSHIILRELLHQYTNLTERDRAFITRLVEGTIEYTIQLDFILNKFSKTHTKNMDPLIRTVLRMSSYQILYMDKVPDSAAINEAVKFIKEQNENSIFFLSGYVNGVLRSVSREKENIFADLAHTGKTPAYIRLSTPLWLYDYLRKIYGKEETEKMLQWFLTGSKENYVRFKDGHSEVMDGNISKTKLFKTGEISIQDYASQQVGIEAAPKDNDYILDVCAAPGGKSCHVAELLKGTGHVDARDLTEDKVRLIQENIDRLGLKNISARAFDARTPDESLINEKGEGKADIVLADLPCSGLGIIGKKPDIRFGASLDGIKELQALQREILTTVVRYVKPGGKLVYSTCTLSKEENEDNRDFILELPGFTLLKERKFLPGEPSDGFYLCVFRKD
ncbi:transcription antitermination factor NusB [Oribacterium sp. P6A1]|uniref:transcription antitermination factor NusB n=1 Tax=Oribacterium sp. P6A1 TaxID=1410612 RepID=UPI000691616A|nr:transcription antitermination factor NusB [Oribacterium sp. P6A1]